MSPWFRLGQKNGGRKERLQPGSFLWSEDLGKGFLVSVLFAPSGKMGDGLAEGHKASSGQHLWSSDVHSCTNLGTMFGAVLVAGRRRWNSCILESLLESLKTATHVASRGCSSSIALDYMAFKMSQPLIVSWSIYHTYTSTYTHILYFLSLSMLMYMCIYIHTILCNYVIHTFFYFLIFFGMLIWYVSWFWRKIVIIG